jgi:hypothetical protein
VLDEINSKNVSLNQYKPILHCKTSLRSVTGNWIPGTMDKQSCFQELLINGDTMIINWSKLFAQIKMDSQKKSGTI